MGKVYNWSTLCGQERLVVWRDDDFGPCFRQMALEVPIYAILAVISAFYLGNRALYLSRSRFHLNLLTVRKLIVCGLALCPVVLSVGRLILSSSDGTAPPPPPLMEYLSAGVQVVGWLVHAVFLLVLRRRVTVHSRGPRMTLLGWSLTTLLSALDVRTCIVNYPDLGRSYDRPVDQLNSYVTFAHAALQVLYFCTLIPKGRAREVVPSRLINAAAGDLRRPLVADSFSGSYGAVAAHHPDAVSVLGPAEGNAHILSRLSLSWVKPLLRRGGRRLLNSADDLFELPGRLKTTFVDTTFWIAFRDLQLRRNAKTERERRRLIRRDGVGLPPALPEQPVSMLSALIHSFGTEYFLLGSIKVLADGAAFAGPLLLNLVVSFVEGSDGADDSSARGYYFVLGLFAASFVSALCGAQFTYLLNNVSLKVRAAVVSTVYRKTLHLRSSAQLSIGQIVNYMSTDTDHLVNLCISFHEFWSMPVKIAVCLVLLHMQVGLAYVAGVGFAVLLVPITHCIAKTIGRLSTAMLDKKDKRVKLMTEILYGIRVIKYYCWEDHLWSRVQQMRGLEVKSLKGRKYLDAFCVFFWAVTPVIIAVLTFTTYMLLGNTLTVAKVFTCLTLFNMLIIPLNSFPWVVGGVVQGFVSLRRVQKILEIPEVNLSKCYTGLDDSSSLALYIRNGHFAWKSNNASDDRNDTSTVVPLLNPAATPAYQFELRDVNFEVQKRSLVGVVGPVGSGKSSFLLAIMAEMEILGGEIGSSCIAEGFAYVAQEPWIQNASVRQNVTFGRAFHHERYNRVIHACALEEELKAFPNGDDTLIGERGITLSGGQKTRISLARAIYQDKDVYLMDDILSTVDVHVAQHLMQHCIFGILEDKTRILCTHHWRHLTKADSVLLLRDGRIVKQGLPAEVLSDLSLPEPRTEQQALDVAAQPLLDDNADLHDGSPDPGSSGARSGSEEWEHGSVKMAVYKAYGAAVGVWLTPLVLLFVILMQASRNVGDWWLAYWMSQNSTEVNVTVDASETFTVTVYDGTAASHQNFYFYLTVYGILAGSNALLGLLRAFSFAFGGIRAAVDLHNRLLATILKASTSFFDVTPVGRVVNRFSTDTNVIDDDLPFVLNILLAQSIGLIGSLVLISYSLPWLLLLLVPLGGVYTSIQHYYRHTSRQLRRLEAVTLSPIYAHFSETVLGLVSVRAFRAEARFKKENEERLERNQRTQFALGAVGGWLSLRLQLIGVGVVTGIGLLAVLEHHLRGINPGLVGLALSYGLSITAMLSSVVQFCTDTEKQLVSVERTLQYIVNVKQERWHGFKKPPLNWPCSGVVAFHSVLMRYKEHHPYSLNKVTFSTKPCEKVGIVGRTGAGKSSLFAALFRLVELESGGITIDGEVLAFMDLKDLRSQVTVIPQDPFIFSDSVRNNLDPSNQSSDQDLWQAINMCHLGETVERLGGLDAHTGDRGSHMSMGQRQLLCLARAIITKAKILCIDEATANVDHETDRLLQETIRSAFIDSTVLTIAHRLETVMDSDRILVMDRGCVLEMDSPEALLADTKSEFYRLVQKQEWSQ